MYMSLSQAKASSGRPAQKLTFIASETYGHLSEFDMGQQSSEGLIALQIRSPNVQQFDAYLADKFPGRYF